MPLKIDLNVAPYYDDYNENKNYHRVLFRPAVAVQARELTQLQTILQNQIERFGNWAFRNGDIVSGCTITDVPVLPYVRLVDFASNGSANSATLDVGTFVNCVITSVSSGLKAKVLYANAGFTTDYPDTNVLYLKYLNTGGTGQQTFGNAELLQVINVQPSGNTVIANVYSWANTRANTYTTGNAHGISSSEGIVYIQGNFVRVIDSTFGLVNNYGTYAGNSVVGFDLSASIITENQDESLLDNAIGAPNENAPGAHRLKLIPTIITLTPEQAAAAEDFNPIATYNFGALVSKAGPSSNLYSIVGDVVSKRTFEESGNYVVNPFAVDTVTSINDTGVNLSLSPNTVLGRVSPGIGYAQGNRVEVLKTSYVNMRRGVDTDVINSQQVTFNYGNFFVVNEYSGVFEFDQNQTVKFYNKPLASVTTRSFAGVNPTANNTSYIGSGTMKCVTYNGGIVGSNAATYLIHVYNIKMESGYNVSQIKSLYYDGAKKGVADVIAAGLQSSQNKRMLFSFGVTGIKNLRDEANNINTQYIYRAKKSGTLLTNGNSVIIIANSSPGGTDILPYGGNNVILTDANALDFTVVATANADSSALTGTVSVNTTSQIVTGSGTNFVANFIPGDLIRVNGVSGARSVTYVTNSTSMAVDSPFSSSASGATFFKTYIAGKVIPIQSSFTGSPNGSIVVTNSTSFTIVSGQAPSNPVAIDVYYNVLRTVTTPAAKVIRKNRFVKLDTTSNPRGPWCLGLPDVHKINRIYGTSNGVYTTAGADITDLFTYDTGQKDTHYDYAYLYPKGTYSANNYPNILVNLDYFTTNTQPGVGFFTIESYPIDDANTANTNAIQTKDIPLYIDDNGNKLPLKDYIDFRVPAVPTANDTGVIANTANATQVATAISYATVNPSSNLVQLTYANGLNIPAYSQNFESDYTRYLPRKDLVMITPDNKLKVKEGVSSLNPQAPLFPDNAMALSVINVPVYPSLSTDQLDEFLTINQRSRSLIRDTSTAISGSLVTNRRYTMKDIGTLDQRITNLEYYTQLSLLEKKAKDLTVTDVNGLDRFKNGIFVDPFSDFTLCDVSNQEFNIAIDTIKGIARPKIIREIINIEFNQGASTNIRKTGRMLTLDYTEIPFIRQPYCTKYRSSALVAFGWNGSIVLVPPYDNHGDIINTGSINITVDNSRPWREFAASPFAYTWGDWRTTTRTDVSSVVTGQALNINLDLGNLGAFGGNWQQTAANRAIAQAAQRTGLTEDFLRGNATWNFTGNRVNAGRIDINQWSPPRAAQNVDRWWLR